MGIRILPPHPELRRMIVDECQSYSAIAKKYNVAYESVYQTFKRGTELSGEEWPVRRNLERAKRKGLDDAVVDSGVVRDLYAEVYEERNAEHVGETVSVSVKQARIAETQPSREVRYHRADCVHVPDDSFTLPRETAAHRNYEPCVFCCRLSYRAWAGEIGVSAAYLCLLMAGHPKVRRIRKPMAVKLLRAIGEDPHPVLEQWRSSWSTRSKSGGQSKWMRAA
jgi:hypothetical protein